MPLRLSLPKRWPIYLLGALIVALCLVTVVGEHGVLHLWRLRGEKERLDEQNYRLQKDNAALRDRVNRIRTDDRYLEKLAREELNLVRPGEVIYRFANTAKRDATRKSANERALESRSEAAQKDTR